MVVGGVSVALAIALGAALSSGENGPAPAVAFNAPQTVIVADVENRTADSTLGDLLSEALRTELQESKIVTVMTPGATASALQRMQRPAASRVNAALAREIAVREGVPVVVEGRIQKVGNTYLVRAGLVSPSDGAERSPVQETAASEDELIAAIGRLARRMRERLGESQTVLTALPPMERVTTTSLDALRKYSEALRLGDGLHAKAVADQEIALLEDAVTLDSTFAMAWRRLGVRLLNGGMQFSNTRLERGKAALKRAYDLRDKLSPVERGLAEAAYFTDVVGDPTRATMAYQAILTEQPSNRIALNNLANSALQQGAYERVREYGARYVAVDSSNMQAWPWLLWGAYGTGRVEEARVTRALMRKRFTSPEQVAQLNVEEMTWLALERDWAALEVLSRRMLTSAPDYRAEDRALRSLMNAFVMRGRLEDAWRVNDSVGARRLASSDTTERRVWRGDAMRQRYFDRAWYAGDTAGAGRAIVLYRDVSGVDRWRMKDRPNANLVLDYLAIGNPRVARERFTAYRTAAVAERGSGDLPPVGSSYMALIEAQVLLGERRAREALRILIPLASDSRRPPLQESFVIGDAYLALGERDSARVWLSRLIESSHPDRVWVEPPFRARALTRLCDLADTPAERQQWCGALASEWKGADAILRPLVDRARRRLAE